jgi:TolB-like protein/Tfp pilus assembly protein PilF
MADPAGSTDELTATPAPPASPEASVHATAPTNTWARIKEHKIIQWGLGYLGAAIAIAHGQELMAEAFDWPHLVGRILMSLLVLGFPLVLTLAWYHGHKGLRKIGAGELAILSVLVLIAAGLLVVLVRVPDEHLRTLATQTEQKAVVQSAQPALAAPEGVSLAVLPFVDMSPEHNQDYFSDGLSEELLNQLAQISELRVTGRTSSFSFKGKNEDLRVIGEKLGVGNLLEGSVRKEGNHLRITAQLINARDGIHIWSRTYDRDLSGVFAVQEEIAKDVSGALSIKLNVGEMSRARGGTTNVDAYDLYLRAQTLIYQLGPKQLTQSIQLYREALALDPNFSRAWGALYAALTFSLTWIPENSAAELKEMSAASAHIVSLAPDAWWTQAMRTGQFEQQHKWSEAGAAASAALASAPTSEIQVITNYGFFLVDVGRTEEAVDYLRRAREMDPLSLGASGLLQLALDCAGRRAEAQAEYERSREFAGDHAIWDWWAVQRLWSRKDAAPAAVVAQFHVLLKHESLPMALSQTIVRRLDNREAALSAIREAFKDPSNQDGTRMAVVAEYADHFGDKDTTLAALRRSLVELHGINFISMWQPYETGLRSDPRFKDLLRDLGLVDYFRMSGIWGDFCKPLGKDDFECH